MSILKHKLTKKEGLTFRQVFTAHYYAVVDSCLQIFISKARETWYANK